jgi:tetratricopeptide (TPR) repeat protein/DNA-binding CsgD family transcriptional regulator
LGQSTQQDSLLNLLETKPQSEHAFLYNELSSIKTGEEKFKESTGLAHKALKLAKEFENFEEEYYALTNIAYNHLDVGEIDTSIFYGKEALRIARQIGKPALIARVYNHLGNAYLRIPIFDKALSSYLASLKIVEDTLPNTSWEKNQSYNSLILNNIGTVYNKLGQTEKALDFFNKSLKIRRQQNDLSGIATCLQNIGIIHEQNEDFDSTLLLYNEALKIRKKLNQQSYIAELLMNIGIVSIETKQYDLAETKLKKAIQIFKKTESKRLLSFAYQNMAKLYMKMNKPEFAYPFILKSIKISELHSYRVYERDAYILLSEYFALKKNYKQAWESQKKQIVLSDSIFNSEMTTKVTEMQTKYETEKKEKEIEILTRDNEIQSLKIKRKSTQVYILIIFVILIILLLLVTFLMFNRRRLKQRHIKIELEKSKLLESKLKEENAYQSKQLTTHALNMLQKNKLLLEMDNELKTYAPKTDDMLKKKLNSIRRQIKRNMNSENDWDLFKLYFEEVNKNFFSTLQENCKDLTTGDQKLAALIKLNLNIKEAAAVLNISPDSLKKARYRLRLKLGLYNRENLADYLNRIS